METPTAKHLQVIIEAINKTQWTDLNTNARDYGHLQKKLLEVDCLPYLEERLAAEALGKTKLWGRINQQGIFEITDPLLRIEQGLLFLRKLKGSTDLTRDVMNYVIALRTGSGVSEGFNNVYEQLLEPTAVFIEAIIESVDGDNNSENGSWSIESIAAKISDVMDALLEANGLIIGQPTVFRSREFSTEPGLIFVIGEFNDQFLNTLLPTIKRSAKIAGDQLGIEMDVRTAGEQKGAIVIEDIWMLVCKSCIVIADIGSSNFNVGYELGITHAVGKTTILLFDSNNALGMRPAFDIQHNRQIRYTINDLTKLEDQLTEWFVELYPQHSPYPVNTVEAIPD